MIRLLLYTLYVIHVALQCDIGSFSVSPSQTTVTEGDTITLKCEATSTSCNGRLQITGTDITNTAIMFSTYIYNKAISITTAGAQIYECEFDYGGQVYMRTLDIQVQAAPCKIADFSYSALSATKQRLSCTGDCKAQLTIFNSNGDALTRSQSVSSVAISITLETTGTYKYSCQLQDSSTSNNAFESLSIAYIRPCGISSFQNSEFSGGSIDYIILKCYSNCSGVIRMTGPSQFNSAVTISTVTGGNVERYVESAVDNAGTYYCYFTSDTTGSEKFTETLTVEVDCSMPTISTSSTSVFVGETFTVICENSCDSGYLRLGMWNGTQDSVVTGTTDNILSYSLSREISADLRFTCVAVLSIGNKASLTNFVSVEDCEIGESYTACGTSCDVISCDDDVTRQDSCVNSEVCEWKCRCPDARPYWYEDSCVSDCDEAASVGFKIWWIVLALVIILAIAALVVICICCKRKKRPRKEEIELQPKPKQFGHINQNNLAEYYEDEPIYEDDIQYSEEPAEYDYDHYLKPSLDRADIPTFKAVNSSAPEIPSAPIPTIKHANEYTYNDPASLQKQKTIPDDSISSTSATLSGYNNLPSAVDNKQNDRLSDPDILEIKFSKPDVLYENNQN